MQKLKDKITKLSKNEIVAALLWIFTLLFLVIFVVLASTLSKKEDDSNKTVAAGSMGKYSVAETQAKADVDFGIDNKFQKVGATTTEITTTDAKKLYVHNHNEFVVANDNNIYAKADVDGTNAPIAGKTSLKLWWAENASFEKTVAGASKSSYANSLAAMGAVFTVSLFSAIIFTVGMKYSQNRKGGSSK